MGVVWLTCDCCRETFYEGSGTHVRCDCGGVWCSRDCAAKEGYDADAESCRYCRGEHVDDESLLCFLLATYKLSREEAEALYRRNEDDP